MIAPAKSLRAALQAIVWAINEHPDRPCPCCYEDEEHTSGCPVGRAVALLAQVPQEPVAWVLRTREGPPRYVAKTGPAFTRLPRRVKLYAWGEADDLAARWVFRDTSQALDLVPVYLGEPEREGEP